MRCLCRVANQGERLKGRRCHGPFITDVRGCVVLGAHDCRFAPRDEFRARAWGRGCDYGAIELHLHVHRRDVLGEEGGDNMLPQLPRDDALDAVVAELALERHLH